MGAMSAAIDAIDHYFVVGADGTLPYAYRYGGHGALLSRGLLDRLPTVRWAQCARQLVCGAADHRLATCIHHLQPSTRLKIVHDNRRFLRTANLSANQMRSEVRAAVTSGGKAQTDRQGKMFDTNPLLRDRFLALFRARQLCPWSIHKLPPHRAQLVHAAARHCIDDRHRD